MALASYSSRCTCYNFDRSVHLLLLLVLLSRTVSVCFSLFKSMLKTSFSCLCCPWKRRRRRINSSLVEHPHIVYNLAENDQYLDDSIFQAARPSSVSSTRTAHGIQLGGLTSPRENKPIPHYATPLKKTGRVAPSSASSMSQSVSSNTSSISPAEYLFGSRQASKLIQRE
jgi:hypothetical protein